MNNEIWKPVYGYDGLYDVSNLGRIYNYRKRCYSFGYVDKNGRYKFALSKEGKTIQKLAYRVIYEAFISPIPKGYDIHHINHISSDNRLENLELIKSNVHRKMHYNESKNRLIKSKITKCSKPIIQYTKNGEFIAEYSSAKEASSQTKINQGNISMCCLNKYGYKTAGGYIWKFKS